MQLLALGDSLTAGYGLEHEQAFTSVLQQAIDKAGLDAHVLDGGVSGDTSTGAVARLDWALGDNPDAAIVELGGNDGLRGQPPAQMERNIAAILDRLQTRHIPVLLSGMMAPPNMGQDYARAFAAAFERLSHRPGLLYDPFFLQGVATHEDFEQGDHIHPNAAGVRVIVARLMPQVRALIGEARHR
ncbi:arylesterase [Lichenicoccus sp.]|uniref:arylesterase n=1 Tax=Lichenicoccus sp. TaxID=2781899 RepID=UPI003D0BA2F1